MNNELAFGASGYASAGIQLFRDIAGMDQLLADFPVLQLEPGETVPAIVDGNALLYAVLRGALRVSTHAAGDAGREAATGECVGGFSVMGGERRGVYIVATCKTDVLAIDAAGLMTLIGESSGLAHKLLALRAADGAAVAHSADQSPLDLDNGLRNRVWLDQHLPDLAQRAQRAQAPLSMLMINLDYVDLFSVSYGQSAVAEALDMTCNEIIDALRPTDFTVRYSESALAVLLPDTNAETASMVARRLFERMKKTVIMADLREPLPLMASFGVACLVPDQDERDLIGASTAALARARIGGSGVSG